MKTKRYIQKENQLRLVRALRWAAEAHEELAEAYRKYGLYLQADETELEALAFRRRLEVYQSPLNEKFH